MPVVLSTFPTVATGMHKHECTHTGMDLTINAHLFDTTYCIYIEHASFISPSKISIPVVTVPITGFDVIVHVTMQSYLQFGTEVD